MASAQDCHALITWYEKLYEEHYGRKSVVNRNTARWNFDNILKSLPPVEVKSLLEYYFKTASANNHQLTWFFYNYEKLLEGRQEQLNDAEHRKRLREESEKRAKAWRARFGDHVITQIDE